MGAGDTGQNVLGVQSVLLSALCAVMNGCPAQVHPLWAVRDHPDRCCVVALCACRPLPSWRTMTSPSGQI